jgi:hypothetical protein
MRNDDAAIPFDSRPTISRSQQNSREVGNSQKRLARHLKNEPESLHQKRLKLGHPTPGESSKVAVHDVLFRRVDEMTEFLDGVSSSEVPLQFRCDFDRR